MTPLPEAAKAETSSTAPGAANVKGDEAVEKAQTIKLSEEEFDRLRKYVKGLTKRVQSHLVYPDEGRRVALQGAATVSLTILSSGQILPRVPEDCRKQRSTDARRERAENGPLERSLRSSADRDDGGNRRRLRPQTLRERQKHRDLRGLPHFACSHANGKGSCHASLNRETATYHCQFALNHDAIFARNRDPSEGCDLDGRRWGFVSFGF